MQNHLESCYLAGSMEYSADNGLSWREQYRALLEDEDFLGIKCILPNEQERHIIKDQEELNKLKKTDISKYVEIMRQFMELDLGIIDKVDMVIVRWEGETISGTVGEAQHAYLMGIPIYLVTSKPLHEVPGWFLACFTEVFDTLSCLMMYLADKKWGQQ